jgi:hypothetical protein
MLRDLFTDPIYKGAYAYRRHDQKIGQCKRRPPEEWIVREHAFPAIISDEQWNQARARVLEETKPLVDSEMLEFLRRL